MPDENHPLLRNKRQVRNGIRCMNNGKFYRNPDREKAKMWSTGECAKYYLCIGNYQTPPSFSQMSIFLYNCNSRIFSFLIIENEVFEFKCSTGLLFDIVRQICDFKAKVDNCDVNTGLSAFQSFLVSIFGVGRKRSRQTGIETSS